MTANTKTTNSQQPVRTKKREQTHWGDACPASGYPINKASKIGFGFILVVNILLALHYTTQFSLKPENVSGFITLNHPQLPTRQSTAPEVLNLSEPLSAAGQASVHGATLTQIRTPSGQTELLAAWYGGSREGAKDVDLFLAKKPAQADWQPPYSLTGPKPLGQALNRYVKKVGNPVLFTDQSNRVWLFFVSVSVGGWAGSAINVSVSDDGGKSFSPPKRLTTAPFFNVSTLVRNRPVALKNGGLVLPVYHEFIGKFSELLWLDAQGNVLNKQRLTWGRSTLQPSLVAKDSEHAAVFLRVAKPKTHIEVLETRNGGQSFSSSHTLSLPNDNAAVDASLTPNGQWLLVYNHDPNGRNRLSIATAQKPTGPWQRRVILDQQGQDRPYERFSYPVIVADATQPDSFHLLYTVERSFIQYRHFNATWVNQHTSERPHP